MGVFGGSVSAKKKYEIVKVQRIDYDEETQEGRIKFINTVIEQLNIAYHHIFDEFRSLKVGKKRFVDLEGYAELDRKRKLVVGGRNIFKKLFKSMKNGYVNFSYSSIMNAVENYLRAVSNFDEAFDDFIEEHNVMKKFDENDKEFLENLKEMRKNATSFLKSMIKSDKKRKKKNKKKRRRRRDDDD